MAGDFGTSQSGRGYRKQRRQDDVTEQMPVNHRKAPIAIHATLSRALIALTLYRAVKFLSLR